MTCEYDGKEFSIRVTKNQKENPPDIGSEVPILFQGMSKKGTPLRAKLAEEY